MAAAKTSRYEARAIVLKALGHPSRMLIVDALSNGPLCVADLRRKVGSNMSTVSKHLSLLKDAGVVVDKKSGVQVFYRLRCKCVTNFFLCAERVLELAIKDRMVEYEKESGRAPRGKRAMVWPSLKGSVPVKSRRTR